MSPFSSTLNLQPSFPGRSYFDFRSSPHQLSLHSSLQSLNAPGELSSSDLCFWSLCLEGISEIPVLFLPFMCVEMADELVSLSVACFDMRGIWVMELCGVLVCVLWGPTIELWSMYNGIGKRWVKLFFLHKLVPPWIARSVITCSGTARLRRWLSGSLNLEVCNPAVSRKPAVSGGLDQCIQPGVVWLNIDSRDLYWKTKSQNTPIAECIIQSRQTRAQEVKISAKDCARW